MRQFILDLAPDASPPVAGDVVSLDTSESHHLQRVVRRKIGDAITLTDGEGRRYRGVITRRGGSQVRVAVQETWLDSDDLAEPTLVLACAVVKGRRFEWALEKSVELGVHRVLPLQTEHTVVDPGPGKQERWQAVLRSALKQTGRSYLPRLTPVQDLKSCLGQLHDALVVYGQWPAGSAITAYGFPVAQARPAVLAWLVGPEGGWSQAELSLLASSALPLTLGPHRLRTETAAVAGMVVLQAWRQRWRDIARSANGTAQPPP